MLHTLQTTLFSLVAATLVSGLAVQIPLGPTHQPLGHSQAEHNPADDGHVGWSLDRLPNPDATDHLVFETVHSLLQHWPNTRMRNGHNIVPGIIPNGTLLYHGGPTKDLPTQPEWIATDPEHSYLFCRDLFDPSIRGGWHFTFMANRPLKMLYFDGSGAVKFPFGSMDSQDLLTLGGPSAGDDILREEMERVRDLCSWGKSFGIDGFVRMEMDFEIVYCDFTSGLNLISLDNVASEWSGISPFSSTQLFEVMNSGTWHDRFPGETRIQLDLPGMVSFYDTQLAPSLVPARAGQERWDHRAINISDEDLSAVKSRLAANLMRPDSISSGIDWKTLFQVIVDRYSGRLELTRDILNSSVTNPDNTLDIAKNAQIQLRIMLTPYFLLSTTPTNPSDEDDLDWAAPIYKLCATIHTRSMESQFESMTDSEKLLLQAARGTSREICRVVTKMWTAGVYAGIDPLVNTKESPDIATVARVRETWAEDLNRLMAWLDWNTWVKCNPGCGADEMCYLPTWPVGFPWLATNPKPIPWPIDEVDALHPEIASLAWRHTVMEGFADEMQKTLKIEPDEWIRPQPKCIRRVHPYTY